MLAKILNARTNIDVVFMGNRIFLVDFSINSIIFIILYKIFVHFYRGIYQNTATKLLTTAIKNCY